MVKWIITGYQHAWVNNHLLVLVETNEPIHALLHYSLSPEIFTYITSVRRGISRLVKPLWELANPVQVEQAEPGDTLEHQFFLPAVPDQATLTFYLTATAESIETKSVSIPIKIQHPLQDAADPIDPTPFGDWVRGQVWIQNMIDSVPMDHPYWNQTGMTGTGALEHTDWGLRLTIGATIASVAQIYTEALFDLQLDYTRDSQLRAVIFLPVLTAGTRVAILHGTYIGAYSAYGFTISNVFLYGFTKNPAGTSSVLLATIAAATIYHLEAKHKHGNRVEFWINGTYINELTTTLPNSVDRGFFAWITDYDYAGTHIYFRRFMLWKDGIWTA